MKKTRLWIGKHHLQLPAQFGMDLVHHGVEVAANQDEGILGRLTKKVTLTTSSLVASSCWSW